MNGFTITTDDDTDVDLRHRYNQMKDRSLGNRRFPAGTDGRSQYEFTLECGYKPVMSFSWDDYPGGYLDVKGTGDMDSYKQIEQSILNSSCLFICIDGTLLQGDDIDEKISAIQDDCSIYINPFFSKYRKEHGALPPTAATCTHWKKPSRAQTYSLAYPKETFSHKTWCAVWPIIRSYSPLPTLLPKFPTKMLWHHARMS